MHVQQQVDFLERDVQYTRDLSRAISTPVHAQSLGARTDISERTAAVAYSLANPDVAALRRTEPAASFFILPRAPRALRARSERHPQETRRGAARIRQAQA